MQRLTLPKYQHFTFSSFTIVSKLNPLKPNSSNYYTSLYKPNLHFFWHSGKWLQASQGNAATHVRCGGTNMVLLVIYRSLQQRKNFANWSRIDKVMAMVTVAHFLTRGVVAEYRWCFKRTLYQSSSCITEKCYQYTWSRSCSLQGGPKKADCFLTVRDSRICWHTIAFYISNCSVFYPE